MKNKYYILLSIVCIGLITWYTFFSGYKDWSELNDFVEKECIVNGKSKKTCIVDFHKLDFAWNNIYYIRGSQGERYIHTLLGKENIGNIKDNGIYLIFFKNKKLVKIYEQINYFFSFWHHDGITNTNNTILLLQNDEEKNINECKSNFLLTKDYESSTKKKTIYLMSCLKILP